MDHADKAQAKPAEPNADAPLAPRAYQQTAIALAQTTNLLLADDRGLGKTLQGVLSAAKIMVTHGGATLIICTKTARDQWRAAIKKQFPNDPVMTLEYRDNFQDARARERYTPWIITHFEAVVKHQRDLGRLLWGAVIVDEAHKIRNREAQRTVAIKRLSATRKLALSGSIIETNPTDLWAIINWLHPDQFRSYWAFHEEFAIVEEDWRGYKKIARGCKNPEKLARLLQPFTLARTKQQVAPELPPKNIVDVPLQMDDKQRAAYNRIKRDETGLVRLSDDEEVDPLLITNAITKLIRLQQIATDPRLLGSDAPSAKLSWLDEFFEETPDEPTIIFTRFRDVARRLAERYRAVGIYGGAQKIPGGLRPDRHRRIVATIDAAAESLDLPWITSSIFLDAHWSSVKMEQAEDRVHRLTVTSSPNIYRLVAAPVDKLIWRAVVEKWTEAKLIYEYLRAE